MIKSGPKSSVTKVHAILVKDVISRGKNNVAMGNQAAAALPHRFSAQ